MAPFRMSIPPSFSLAQEGKTFLLLRDDFREMLLERGILAFESFLSAQAKGARYWHGRTPHPSLPLAEGRRVVVRRYTHGGLLRSLTGDLFLFGSRSFRELALTEEIRSQGIPTLEPIGAVHRKIFPFFYRAYLLSLEIPQARSLLHYLHGQRTASKESLLPKRKLLRSIGLLIRRFHDAGFFHGDLQLKNILIVDEEPFLIDFDRSYRKPGLSMRGRMKNLLRLQRSMEKWRGAGLRLSRTDPWRIFSAYAQGDPAIRKALRNLIRHHRLRLFRYRLSWTLDWLIHGEGRGLSDEGGP